MPDLNFITRLPIAHRGLHNVEQNIVENSYGSVKAAIEMGYAIEIDIQLTKDGQAIVFHDETLDRMTENSGNVMDYTLSELVSMTQKANGEKLLSFPQLLALVKGQVPLIVEVKCLSNDIKQLVDYVADELKDYLGEICVMSFNPMIIRQFKKIAPKIVRGIVAERNMQPQDWPNTNALMRFIFKNLLHWPLIRPHFISYHLYDLPTFCIKIARFFNIPVITWTVKSPKDAEHTYKYADQITFEQYLPKK